MLDDKLKEIQHGKGNFSIMAWGAAEATATRARVAKAWKKASENMIIFIFVFYLHDD